MGTGSTSVMPLDKTTLRKGLRLCRDMTPDLLLISRLNEIMSFERDIICRSNKIICRSNEMICRSNEIICRSNDIRSHSNDIISRSNDISHSND